MKEKRAGGMKGEDPEIIARREEEKRRWEESQRESQRDEMERRNKTEILRQQRAEEAANLVAHRSANAGAKAIFEQTRYVCVCTTRQLNISIIETSFENPTERSWLREFLGYQQDVTRLVVIIMNPVNLNKHFGFEYSRPNTGPKRNLGNGVTRMHYLGNGVTRMCYLW